MAASTPRDRFSERLRVAPGASLDLRAFDPNQTFGWKREDAEAEEQQYETRLTELQDRLWAEGKQALLIVLQGIDAAGKDGTIRHVMDAFNPQGCHVVGFKAPTPQELSHDFLWRIHPHTPGKGSVAIFNRSHYEDVLIVRVHDLVPREVWSARYRSIKEWERMLVEAGTTIVKFFLYIDRDEQRERLQARLDDPTKRWKFSTADLPERERWDDYIEAFQDAIVHTSTKAAPWYLIPANRKWFRNLAVAHVLGETLERLDPQYPEPDPGLDDIRIPK